MIQSAKSKKTVKFGSLKSVLTRKKIPLCRKHHVEWYMGNVDIAQIKTNIKEIKILENNKI
jgi:hypothetical protein